MKKPIFSAVFIIALAGSLPQSVFAQSNNNGFWNNLFGGGQRAQDRRSAEIAQRRINREIQTALNFFDFDVGAIDGILGRKSRQAIGEYQFSLGFPETGRLAPAEKDFLLSAYDLIIDGGQEANWQLLSNADGAQGVLKWLFLEENPFAPVETAPVVLDPSSMRSICINLGASGPVDLVKAQFCNLRQLAINQAEYLVGVNQEQQSLAQILPECSGFAEAMIPNIVALVGFSPDEAGSVLATWTSETEMETEAITRLAKTCLGAGYAHDNASVALASSLALTGLGEAGYQELSAYHIAFGMGLSSLENYDLAVLWLISARDKFLGNAPSITGQAGETRAAIVTDLISILSQEIY